MFVQIIEGKVKDADLLLRQTDRWAAEIKPGVKGYLGSTGGVTSDGQSVWIARFESAEAAASNSGSAQQDAWWNETAKAYDGEPRFHDCTEIDTLFGGGSNDARFVQVMQGQVKDQAALRSRLPEMESELRDQRPDILGILIAWHGNDGKFTQAIYFTSQDEARKYEKETENSASREEFMSYFVGPPTFYDFADPRMD